MSLLEFNSLSVGYEKNILIKNINLKFSAGQIVVLIGPNGSGKSTILKTLTKQIKSAGGSVSILNHEIEKTKESEVAKLLSMVSTERVTPEKMTCREVIATGRFPHTGTFGTLSDEDWKKVDEAVALVHAEDICDKDFSKISDGQRQRVMLGRAICQDTEVIALDEPTSYLDMFYKLDLLKIVWNLAKLQNKLIIMSLHELELVRKIADVVICVDGKKIVKCGTVAEVFEGNFIQNLFGLKAEEFDENTGMLKLQLESTQNIEAVKNVIDDGELKKNTAKKHHAKIIMIQGTMSNAGKSFLAAGLCRIFKQDGYRVAPFKAQNMALNSFITKDGLEMGRAQVMQAEACGIEPEVFMNPVLLKPTSDKGSQVIVNGEVVGNMEAREYFEYKKQLVPGILQAFRELEKKADIIVIEGAGSPAEINLRKNDIVNMGLAELVDAPVLLAADIDRGGVFAQLLGTLELLSESERQRVKGLVINKFRGDKSILDSGIEMLEKRSRIPVSGVIPYMNVTLDDEDSLSSCFEKKNFGIVNIGVIRLPRISNFTDFAVFEHIDGVAVHYLGSDADADAFARMDILIIPGSKNTISDLRWMRETGIEACVKRFAEKKAVFGICGGYQMLGELIEDPAGVEGGGKERGLELLKVRTVLQEEKVRKQVSGVLNGFEGLFAELNGRQFSGYEIHMGKTAFADGVCTAFANEAVVTSAENVYGTYVHGIFDEGNIALDICRLLANAKGMELPAAGNGIFAGGAADGTANANGDFKSFKETQYDLLAENLRKSMDISSIYKMLRPAKIAGEDCDD